MERVVRAISAAAIIALLGAQAFGQGAPQTAGLTKVDPATVATGYRVTKVIGSTVVNEANETVGTIDDLIVTPNEVVPFAVLSVGGFLGMGTKYVVVPYSALKVQDRKMVLPGATKNHSRAFLNSNTRLSVEGDVMPQKLRKAQRRSEIWTRT